jgi:hypothetical protein
MCEPTATVSFDRPLYSTTTLRHDTKDAPNRARRGNAIDNDLRRLESSQGADIGHVIELVRDPRHVRPFNESDYQEVRFGAGQRFVPIALSAFVRGIIIGD